ncbi:hypothetical protein D3C76_698190 [compost metagenome]
MNRPYLGWGSTLGSDWAILSCPVTMLRGKERQGMANFKSTEMRFLDSIFDMEGGYVLDFSDRTMGLFFSRN